ncbi:PAS domain S-box protein [bacterium]|nr:PAS domain S-box protein [bacterium]
MGENVKFEVQNMRDEDKTKEQVITELNELRQRIAFFEASEIEHKRTEKKLRQSERELFIGNRIRDIFLTVPDDEMYGEVLQVVLEAMESKYGVFGYIDDDGDLVCPSITRDVWEQCNIPDKSIRFPRETWGDRIWGQAMIEKRSLYSNERMPVPDGHLPILRVLVVPVIHQGEVIGNFQIANKATDYDEKDKKLLEQIADHVAPILQARLQRDYQERIRMRWEDATYASEERMRSLLRASPDLIFLFDGEGRFLEVLTSQTQLLIDEPEMLIGKKVTEVFPDHVAQPFHKALNRAIETGKVESIEYELDVISESRRFEGRLSPILQNIDGKQTVLLVSRDITEQKKAAVEQEKLIHALKERVKELNCLYSLSSLIGKPDISLDEIFQRTVNRIPPSCQYPDITCARIAFDGKEYRTDKCTIDECIETEWEISSDIKVHKEKVGTITVRYIEEKPEVNEAPFLKEERELLNAIADMLGETIKRVQLDNKLHKSEEKHKRLVHNIPGMVYEGNRDWSAEIINGCEELCGYTSEELKSNEKNWFSIIHPDDRERIFREGSELSHQKKNLLQTYRIITREGDIRWVEDHKSSSFSEDETFMGVDGVVFDITDRVQTEEQIQASLQEKEVLLKEVHHRVKNNMQIISSLLSLQGESIEDEQVLDIFKVSQNRIKSMALVHERLYQSQNLAKVDFASYIKDLASRLFRSYETSGRIALSMDVPDVFLSIDNAIPCGLILNELVSNSLKHAFPEGRDGEINITLRPYEGKFELVVSDNGVGIPEDLDIKNTESLGFRLVTSLVSQLDGEIELSRADGTEFRLTFVGGASDS